MPILNMVWWWKKWGNIWEPLNLTVTSVWLDATITWEDNEIWTIPPTSFQKSELVRKVGSAPTSPSDWDLVVTETVKDTYKVSGYTDSWLTDWTTYYYRVFSYSDLWGISYCDAVSVTIDSSWHPWANTVLYLPLDWDVVDYSTYNRTFTVLGSTSAVWSPVFDTIASGKEVGDFIKTWPNDSNWFAYTTSIADIPTSWNMTLSAWINCGTSSNYYEEIIAFRWNGGYRWMLMKSDADKLLFHWTAQEVTTLTPTVWTWYNIVVVIDSWTCYIYSNWTQIYSDSYSYWSGAEALCLGAYYNSYQSAYREETYNGKLSEVIIENVAWTQQEISDYFDQTKANYWIS